MRWSMNQITLHGGSRRAPDDFGADLRALRAGGWRAIELWLPHWDGFTEREGGNGLGGRGGLEVARRLLQDSGLTVTGGCGLGGSGSLFFSRGAALEALHGALERRLEQCQALGARHLVIAPGFDLPERPERPGTEELEHAATSLRRAAGRAAAYGVRLGIEFLAGARLVSTLPTALALTERVRHPLAGVVVDTYHLYAGRSKSEDIDLLRDDPSRLFFMHVSDVAREVPRDLWTVPDRTLPGAGGVPNSALLERARALGFDGDVSLELFSAAFEAHWEADPEGAARLAYERCTALTPDAGALDG